MTELPPTMKNLKNLKTLKINVGVRNIPEIEGLVVENDTGWYYKYSNIFNLYDN